MESKIDRKMCGTCVYWNAHRELLPNKNKVAILDDMGICQCPISSKSGELRKKELNCKSYENFAVKNKK